MLLSTYESGTLQLHCINKTLFAVFLLFVYIASASKVNPPKHAQNVKVIALLEDQKQSVCVCVCVAQAAQQPADDGRTMSHKPTSSHH